MPLNFGYAGIGKETTYGTAVAPTAFFRLQEVAHLEADQKYAEVPGIDDFGLAAAIATTRTGKGDLAIVATPAAIGHLFSGLLGAPATTGTAPNYTFTPKATVPSYTIETQDGTGVEKLLGAKVSEVTLTHAADGLLTAKATLMGADKVVGGTPSTPAAETTYFVQQMVGITFNALAHAQRAEDLEVRLSFNKELHAAFGQQPAAATEPTGEGDVTAQMTLRYSSTDDAGKFADMINGTTRSVSIVWTKDANTSLTVAFTAYITADPYILQNRDLRTARVRLSLRAVRSGSPLVTLTLKNQNASY